MGGEVGGVGVGEVVGFNEGFLVGFVVGLVEGFLVVVGCWLGNHVGCSVGSEVGFGVSPLCKIKSASLLPLASSAAPTSKGGGPCARKFVSRVAGSLDSSSSESCSNTFRRDATQTYTTAATKMPLMTLKARSQPSSIGFSQLPGCGVSFHGHQLTDIPAY